MPGQTKGRKRTRTVSHAENSTDKKAKVHTVSHRSYGCVGGCVLSLGQGDTGQLGLGPDIMERTKPARVPVDKTLVQVCSGGMHTVCLTEDGKVITFGCNDEGALGRTTADEDDCSEPGNVELDSRVVFVSAGDSHTAALTSTGTVYAWGTFRDANGPIGLLPGGKKSLLPVAVFTDPPVVKICSGTDHIVFLTEDGEIYTVGCAEQGQLGRVAECFSQRGGRKGLDLLLSPGPVHCKRRRTRFSDVWTGQYATYAKARDSGDIYSWGLNNYYQLGFADMENRFMPERSPSFSIDKDWQAMSGGQHHALALDKQGQVYSLGRKEYGRLGLGEENLEEKAEPTAVPVLKNHHCVSIDAGTAVSFAVTDKGELFAWGMGTSNQLGQSEDDDLFEPVRMMGKQLETRNVVGVSAGGQHTILLARDKS